MKQFKFMGRLFYYANGDFLHPGIYLRTEKNNKRIIAIPRFLAR